MKFYYYWVINQLGSSWLLSAETFLLLFVEFIHGFLIEACLPVVIAQLGRHRLDLVGH